MSALTKPRSPPGAARALRSGGGASESPLVLTKMRQPSLRPRTVDRAHLLGFLDAEPSAGLILVSAPAGYGKTTLLTAWSQARAGASVAWYALDASDDDPITFGSYLVGSLSQALGPPAGLFAVEQRLRTTTELDLQHVLPAVINAVAAGDRECLLVLDDYHVITAPAIHQAVTFLVERRPENLRLVVGSRADPPLPLARLRARGQLAEVRADDLRFTPVEAERFLNEVMQLGLAPDIVAKLEARTEGWIAGLQLAALSLIGRADRETVLDSFSGDNRYLIQYLLDEVVSRQPENVQDFLEATSILDRMCAPLCDALLGRGGSDEILEQLERANLFIGALDERRTWYRYHQLFREFLRNRLVRSQPARIAALHRAASEWNQTHGSLREAVRHALDTGDWEYAAQVVERHGMATLMHSEISTVYSWCRAFPEEIMRAHPMLCVLQGWTLVLGYRRDNLARVDELLRTAEQPELEHEQHGHSLAADAAVVRTFLGNAPDAHRDPGAQLAVAQRALDLLPPADPLRSTTTLTIGYAHMALDDLDLAYSTFEQARELSLEGSNYYGAIEARFHQARIAHNRARLGRAAEICRQGQAEIAALIEHPDQVLPAVGSLDIALGCVLLEQNSLSEAERLLLHGLELVGWTVNPYYHMTACVALARLREIQGRAAESLEFLDRLAEAWPDLQFCREALQALHSVRVGQAIKGARQTDGWCRTFAASLGEDLPLPGIGPLGAAQAYYLALLAWARAQVAIGDPRPALAWLGQQLELADRSGVWHRSIELSVAEALARRAAGEDRRARAALAHALELAEPECYVRVFDEGPECLRLLVEAAHHGIAREYIGHLLQVLGSSSRSDVPPLQDDRPPVPKGTFLPEPLSKREIEVLLLLDSGLLNRQIADRLIVSLGTVKRHTANIYGKLGVDTRTQAILRAHELHLI